MKLLSIVVPCYNSQAYLGHCVESLLSEGGEEVEIVIVDDGSTDGTLALAAELTGKSPGIVKFVHQENGGHGEAINTGLANASGIYLKVVDSDDWVDRGAYAEILKTLKGFVAARESVDLLLSNFVYEKAGAKRKKAMRYRGYLPVGRAFGWDEVCRFRVGKYFLMHSLIYRTQLLRECGLRLPAHTFYVDNLYAYAPLGSVETMYYLDVDFYRYYIGREDQSVNEKVMIGRVDQQIKVNKLMISHHRLDEVADKNLRELQFHQIEIMTAISSILLIRAKTAESAEKLDELWDYIRQKDETLYSRLRHSFLGTLSKPSTKPGRDLAIGIYRLAQRIFGFN